MVNSGPNDPKYVINYKFALIKYGVEMICWPFMRVFITDDLWVISHFPGSGKLLKKDISKIKKMNVGTYFTI